MKRMSLSFLFCITVTTLFNATCTVTGSTYSLNYTDTLCCHLIDVSGDDEGY